MSKTGLAVLAMALTPACVFAVDGVTLINQSTVMASGGFPYIITQPGSYRLSGNLTVPNTNVNVIDIKADNVNIDLNGFSIIGPMTCVGLPVSTCNDTAGVGQGIHSLHDDITVVNGTVRGMTYGIQLVGKSESVEKVHVESNSFDGISIESGTVIGNTTTANGGDGIFLRLGTASGNISRYNRNNGITVTCPSIVVDNVVTDNSRENISLQGATTGVDLDPHSPNSCKVAENAVP